MPPGIFLGGRQDDRTSRRRDFGKGPGNGGFMQRAQRRDIRVVACGDLGSMSNGKTGHMALGLQIPERLVGLTQPRKNEAERLTIVINEIMALYPSGYEFLLMLQTCAKLLPPGVIIEPKVLAWNELPCECRCLDQLTDQTARCSDPAVLIYVEENSFEVSTIFAEARDTVFIHFS